jgi:hypothetical protein
MKHILGFVLLCLLSVSANAALVSRAGGLAYYDTVQDITWLANSNLADTTDFGVGGIAVNGSMTWFTAQDWVAAMSSANYLGVSGWRLPTSVQPDANCSLQFSGNSGGFNCIGSEMGHLYWVDGITAANPGPFLNVPATGSGAYWTDTNCCSGGTSNAWRFLFTDGGQYYHPKEFFYFAWAVTDGDALAVVPVPAAVWLFGSALGAMGWMRRKLPA